MRNVTVLGMGIMGRPIARNVARAGFQTRAWNRTREKAEALERDGIEIADSPADAVAGADAVITMLTSGDAVRDVMSGAGGALAAMGAGAIWIQMSTIGIAATDEMAQLAADAGVTFLDAPVSGTKEPAEAGKLVVLAAGPDDALDACAPVFEAIGSRTIRLQEPGEATRLKLVLNNWVLSVAVSTAETIALAERLGIDPQRFLDAIEGGGLDSGYARMKAQKMIERSFDPSFPLALAAKDSRLILDAVDGGAEAPELPRAIERRLSDAEELGHGGEDLAAVYYATAPERSESDEG